MSAFLDIQHDFSTPLAPFFNLSEEAACDVSAREALLDRAMGEGRRRKSSEKLRRGRLPAAGLSFVAKDATGNLVGTVRLWNIKLRTDGSDVLAEALLLGPLAVDTSMEGRGVGSSLMRHAIATARRLGHRAIVLAGDPEYYERFGF